jgi:peptidoglycan/LPS O-acetylase OafA/YrhL
MTARQAAFTYRPDIDGLRAVAVLSVLVFHANKSWAPGGFIGVDIFFVISGYLITGIIFKGIESGSFQVAEFYRRRFRRILPVLAAVIITTLIASLIIMTPADVTTSAYSAIWSLFSAGNLYFTYGIDYGYFSNEAENNPFLHLWSLGVEEQFYIFWPTILLIIGSNRLRLAIVAFVLTMISFILAELLINDHPTFSYYMLPTRAGELLIGALAQLACTTPQKPSLLLKLEQSRMAREVVAWCGALAICVSLLVLSDQSRFPGVNALPVTIGAAALIVSGAFGPTSIRAVLSNPLAVSIGLISYSLYLWHWPIFAFARYLIGDLPTTLSIAGLVLTFALAVLSYRFIESPLRLAKTNLLGSGLRYVVFPIGLSVLALLLIVKTDGMGFYASNQAYRIAYSAASAPPQPASTLAQVCQHRRVTTTELQSPACRSDPNSEPGILMWGDSHAAHYVPVVSAIAEEAGFAFRNIAHSACPPLLTGAGDFAARSYRDDCAASSQAVASVLDDYRAVILSAAWGSLIGQGDTAEQALRTSLETLVANHESVIVIGSAPRHPSLDRSCEQKRARFAWLNCDERNETPRARVDALNRQVESIATAAGAHFIEFNDLLCDGPQCSASINGQLGYFDEGHLSADGAEFLGELAREDQTVVSWFSELAALSPRDSNGSIAWAELDWASRITETSFSDDAADGYSMYRDPAVIRIPAGQQLALRVSARVSLQESQSMVRLLVRDPMRLSYDFLLDHSTVSVRTRNDASDVFWRDRSAGTNLDFDALLGPFETDIEAILLVYPAATSENSTGYDQASQGEITIVSLETALVVAQ